LGSEIKTGSADWSGDIEQHSGRRLVEREIRGLPREQADHQFRRSSSAAKPSGDPGQEYFADGTTEELITTFARLTDVRVTSRTSVMQFKGVQKSAKEIAHMLGVDAIVEGSIARSADTVRITGS